MDSIPASGKLEFYVVNNLRCQFMDEPFTIQRQFTLPQAIALYESCRKDQVSAIGATLDDGTDVDILQRRNGLDTLVTDYQKMQRWKYNPELCVSSVNMLIGTLDVRRQMDGGAQICPLRDRLHVLQLKDGDETRSLRWAELEDVDRMGLKVDMRNYNLVYSQDADATDTPDQLYRRLNSETHPADYRGHSLSMSDVLVYQTRKGCTAYYVDGIGFAQLHRFVIPPGTKEKPGALAHKKPAEREAR